MVAPFLVLELSVAPAGDETIGGEPDPRQWFPAPASSQKAPAEISVGDDGAECSGA
jgi:hypothetical protein